MTAFSRDLLVGWLVDYYVLATVLLLAGLILMHWLKQPARRIAVARAIAGSLLASVFLTAIPGRPRLEWRSTRPIEFARRPITRNDPPPAELTPGSDAGPCCRSMAV